MTYPGVTKMRPPSHLAPETATWWRSVLKDYELEPHKLRLLQAACEAWDRLQQARREISDHGSLTVTAASGAVRPHPAIAVERDARIGFARLIREIGFDLEEPA